MSATITPDSPIEDVIAHFRVCTNNELRGFGKLTILAEFMDRILIEAEQNIAKKGHGND